MDEKEKIIKYTDDDLVKVYRVAFEEGINKENQSIRSPPKEHSGRKGRLNVIFKRR